MRRQIRWTQITILLSGFAVLLVGALNDSPPLACLLGLIVWMPLSNLLLARLRCQKCGKRLMMTPYFVVRSFGLGTCAFCGEKQDATSRKA